MAAGFPLTNHPAFSPPRALRNRQVQTTIGNLPLIEWLTRRRGAMLLATAREWLIDCGDGVRLQGFLSLAKGNSRGNATNLVPEERRIAVVLHGWEGSAESCYVVSLGAELLASGFDVLRLNLRDHGDSHHLNRDIFHSCRLAEVVGATKAVAERFPNSRIFLAGFSLSGNFVLRLSADVGAPETIAGAVAISPVLDPSVTPLGSSEWLRALRAGTLGIRFVKDDGRPPPLLTNAAKRSVISVMTEITDKSSKFPEEEAVLGGGVHCLMPSTGTATADTRDRGLIRVPVRELFPALLDRTGWQRLPPTVRRRFERQLAPGESVIFVGEVAETRRTVVGWVWAQLARLAGAPLPLVVLARTPAIVVVTGDAVGDAQLWTRIYHEPGRLPQVIRSIKSFTGPTGLEERVGGGLAMSLIVSEEQRALVFRSSEYRWRFGRLSLRIPALLTPGDIIVRHREERQGRFSFTLSVVHPVFGQILHQVAFFRDASC
jgi:pimeloyl-ACP methyl ester carboxylesterase